MSKMQQFEFHHYTTPPPGTSPRTWEPLEPGITQMTLNSDPSTGRVMCLQRWEPNTRNEIQNFVHDYIEEIFIVEGDLRDLKGREGGTVWRKGAYAYRKPGMDHGPFGSEGGCLMFITCTPVG
ncbi:uncharacterized protein BDZ99DRAFT_459234 [Mytilinidion resinicola]|uniref:ChrR-like cupin domain-containing protein n=1 Tax=Mytilinidion resinicola TaxID=574789 RepID=A0A6A6Z3V8_9PEZI|nr:uncharacterized protein BDZ99DRAFT_459234 [Mytilinidion resinicola]KAF2815333.1 hypothetical protein BDZ99DRAFT_459234 [Mytilinidion resinicola]